MAPSVLSYASLAGLRHNSTTAETHEHIVFIGNLSHTITSEKLRELFGQFGEVVSSNVPLRATGKPKGFGFVNFATAEAAQAALALNGKDVDGWTIRVNPAEPRTERPAPPSNTLYVDGFATTNQDADLRKMFEPFGVERVRMGEDRKDRRVLGFAHVYVKDQAAAEEAIAKLNGQDVEGRKLRVSFAAPLKKRA
jgi:nucleolin